MFWKTNRSINGKHSKSLMTRRKKRHPLVLTLICQKSAHRWQEFRNILDEFGKSLYTGSVDPEEYLPQLEKKLEATGVQGCH